MSDAEYQSWITSLRPGDEVAIQETVDLKHWRILHVRKVTKIGRIVVEDMIFDPDGEVRSAGWIYQATRLHRPTAAIREECRYWKMVKDLESIRWSTFGMKKLEKILELTQS